MISILTCSAGRFLRLRVQPGRQCHRRVSVSDRYESIYVQQGTDVVIAAKMLSLDLLTPTSLFLTLIRSYLLIHIPCLWLYWCEWPYTLLGGIKCESYSVSSKPRTADREIEQELGKASCTRWQLRPLGACRPPVRHPPSSSSYITYYPGRHWTLTDLWNKNNVRGSCDVEMDRSR